MTERKRLLRLIWINTAIVVAVLAVVVGLTYYLTSKQAAELQAQLTSLTEQEKVMAGKRAELDNITKYIPVLERDGRIISQMFPSDPAQTTLLDFLQQNVEKANSEVLQFEMGEGKELPAATKPEKSRTAEEKKLDEETLKKARFADATLTLRGSFENLLAFMENLKRSNRFFRIDRVEAPSGRQSRDIFELDELNLTFKLEGQVFYLTEKVDVSEGIKRVRESLERKLALPVPEEAAAEQQGLLEVQAGGSSGGKAKPEETTG